MPNSFPLPSPSLNDKIGDDEINNPSFTLLERLEKIVPRNILEVLKTVEVDSNELHTDIDLTDISSYSWPNNERIPSPINDDISSNNPDQAKKLYLLEQLQHVEKELHDKAQQHLKINQEYRQQVNEYITSNPPTTAKKKRTTSSSSTSSSSSSSKPDDQTSSSILPIPSPTINFFSTSSVESNSSSSNQSSHHHHPKIKKTINRQLSKYDRRLEQHMHDNQTHLDEMNMHLKNLKLISSSSSNESTPTKIPMRINTDPQKGLEHLRQLASNPSKLERIQTLANNPNLIKEIQKFANQKPFIEQLRTLQQTSVNSDSLPSQQCQNLSVETTEVPSTTTRHSLCCAEHSSQLTNSSSTSLSHLRFQNRIDVDCETESNHDTALTLACAGGHEELVLLLLQRNANIEHRDKKGFTPLILAGKSFLLFLIIRINILYFLSDCRSCNYRIKIN